MIRWFFGFFVFPLGTLLLWGAAGVSQQRPGISPSTISPVPVVPQRKLLVDEDGICIESQNSGVGNLVSFIAYGEVDATRAEVQKTIFDVFRYTEWIPRTEYISILQQGAGFVLFFGTGTGFPPIVSKRHLLVRLDIKEQGPSTSTLVMKQTELPPGVTAPVMSGVLVPYIQLEWKLEDIPQQSAKTKVTISLTADPGGWIPDWLVKLSMEKYPLHTLQNLRLQVKKP